MTTDDTLAAAADLAALPVGAVAEHGITVMSYMDAAGDPSFGFVTHGTPWLAETLGLIRLAEHALLTEPEDE